MVLTPAGASAQVGQDSVARDLTDLEALIRASAVETADTTYYGPARPRDFNALRYTLDRRHRYRGDQWVSQGLFGHTYLQMGGSVTMHRKQDLGVKLFPQTDLHFYLGKDVSPMVGFRLGVGGGWTFGRKQSSAFWPSTTIWNTRVDADMIYNLSNYILGYRPDRPLQVSAFAGLGLQHNKLTYHTPANGALKYMKTSANDWDAHAGLQFHFFAGSHAAINVEPYFALRRSSHLLRYEMATAGDMSYGVNLSYVYYFRPNLSAGGGDLRRLYRPGSRYLLGDSALTRLRSPFFLEYSAGTVWMDKLPLDNAHGYNISLAMGMWLNSALGWRIGVNGTNASYQRFTTTTNGEDLVRKSHITRGGVYLDALLNPFGFHRNYNWDSQFGVNLVAGLEYGRMKRPSSSNSVNASFIGTRYLGYRVGLQLWTKLSEDLHLNIEPLYTVEEAYRNPDRFSWRLRYGEWGLNAGLTVMLRPNRLRQPVDNDIHKRYAGLFFGGGLGWNTPLYRWKYDINSENLLNTGLMFVGFQFDEYNAVRLMGEYQDNTLRKRNGYGSDNRRLTLLSADYQLSLLNLFSDINPHRHWGVDLYLGPTYVRGGVINRIGMNAGVQLSYRMGSNLSLFFSNTEYWYKRHRQQQASQFFNKWGSLISSFNVGLAYSFNNLQSNKTEGFADNRHYFVEYGVGTGGFGGMSPKMGSGWGLATTGSVGAWMAPYLGFRVGVTMNKGRRSHTQMTTATGTYPMSTLVGLGMANADFLINPFGGLRHYTWDQPYGLNLVLGAEGGAYAVADRSYLHKGLQHGFRFGIQLWTRLDRNIRFFVEPIYTHLVARKKYYVDVDNDLMGQRPTEGSTPFELSNNFSVRMGLSLALSSRDDRLREDTVHQFSPRGYVALGGGFNMPIRQRWTSGKHALNGILFGGYRLSRLSGVRASFEVLNEVTTEGMGKTKYAPSGYDKVTETLGIASLDYELDPVALFAGYNPQRRWSGTVYGGLAVPFHMSATFKDLDGTRLSDPEPKMSHLGLNGGMVFSYSINPHWSVFYNHNIYVFGLWDSGYLFKSAGIMEEVSALNTFNIGLVHKF